MSECKVKITVDVCGESALDQVTSLVVASESGDMSPKMSIRDICKKVAEDFNKENEGATVKWETLRKAYNRANKVGTCPQPKSKSGDMSPTSKKLDVPMVDNTTKEVAQLKEELEKTKKMLNHMVLSKNTQRAEGNVPDMPSIPPPIDDSNVMVDKAELSKLVTYEAELLLLKDDFKLMRSLLTPEQKMLFDNKDSKSDSTFDNIVAEKRKVSEIVAEYQAKS